MQYEESEAFARARERGTSPRALREVGALMWRGVLLGTTLYLALRDDPETNLKLNGISYILALLWAYYDGLFAKRRWPFAFPEAIFLHLCGVQVANLLILLFGNPLFAV